MFYNGVLVHWNTRGGFGFLFCNDLKRRVFFHVSGWNRVTEPVDGELVTFELGPARIPGKPDEAVNVTPVTASIDAGPSKILLSSYTT